jgi:TonB family protein
MKRYFAVAALAAACLAVRGQDPDAAGLIQSAQQAVKQGKFAEADVLYAKAAAGPDSTAISPALWYLGARAAGLGNRLAAEGFFNRLLQIDPKGPYSGRALTWLGNMKRDDPAAAEALFKQALTLEQAGTLDAQETARSYAFLMRQQGRQEEAATLEQTWTKGVNGGSVGMKAMDMPAGVYRVGNGVTAPKLAQKIEPQYTEEARAAKIQGTTVLSVDIDPSGVAENIQVLRSLEPGLDQKAIEAVRQWHFQPGTKDGAPVTVRASIEVNFRLN